MSKRLQIMLQDGELAEIQRSARRQEMTTAEWVRKALRAARRAELRSTARKKLDVMAFDAAFDRIPGLSRYRA